MYLTVYRWDALDGSQCSEEFIRKKSQTFKSQKFKNPEIQNPEIQNTEIQNSEIQNYKKTEHFIFRQFL